MIQLTTIEEVTNQDYSPQLQSLSSPSTSMEEVDIMDFLINVIANLIRQDIRRPPYFSLGSILETDISSIWPRFEMKSETALLKETFAEKSIEDLLEFDIIVRMSPIKEWSAQVKVKSIEKAMPCIVEPEEF